MRIFRQRNGVVLLILNAETKRGHAAKANDGAVLVKTAAIVLRALGTHEKGNFVEFRPEIRAFFQKGAGHMFKDVVTNDADSIGFCCHGCSNMSGVGFRNTTRIHPGRAEASPVPLNTRNFSGSVFKAGML